MVKATISFLLIAIPFLSFAQGWNRIADFSGTARDDGAVFTINNKAYCLTGMQVGFSCTRDGDVLDASTNTWGNMSSLPSGNEREYVSAFSYGGYGYVFGGLVCGGHALNDLWQYNPVNDSWLSMAPLPSKGRCACSSFVINGKAYLIAGLDSASTVWNEVWEYDIGNNLWHQKNNLSFGGFWRGCGFAIDTSGYVCYGMRAGGSFQRSIYRYSVSTDTWTVIPAVTLGPRFYAGAAVVTQKACIYGGIDSAGVLHNDLLLFDPLLSSVTFLPGLPSPAIPRKGMMAFALNNRLYITTGIDSTVTRINETWQNLSPTGISELVDPEHSCAVYPNPSSTSFTIRVMEGIFLWKLRIYEAGGKMIFSQNMNGTSAQFNVGEMQFQPGVYYYQAGTEMKIIGSGKLVILKPGN